MDGNFSDIIINHVCKSSVKQEVVSHSIPEIMGLNRGVVFEAASRSAGISNLVSCRAFSATTARQGHNFVHHESFTSQVCVQKTATSHRSRRGRFLPMIRSACSR